MNTSRNMFALKRITLTILVAWTSSHVSGQDITLRFNEDGKFKIVQFTDLHYKIGQASAARTIQLTRRVLDVEKPDLVVYTGDIITCSPQERGWNEVLAVAAERHIPHAVVLGNHDVEHDWTRGQIMNYLQGMPYCLARVGPDTLKGAGNYILEVVDKTGKTSVLLYFFDSNAYNKVGKQEGFDWIGFDQVNWYRRASALFTRANGGTPYPALAFFHIPLQEYTLLRDTTKNYVRNAPFFGTREEKECPGILNTGLFAAMVESGDVMGTFVGHEHDNDYIGYLHGICLAYGRCASMGSTYSHIGRGARVIELVEGGRRFKTWIRDEHDEVLHEVVYPGSFVVQE